MAASPDDSLLTQLHYRKMYLSDLAAVMQIENASYPFPWTEGIFRDCLRVNYDCCAIEHKGKLVAYAIMSVAASEAHILNLCVAPDYCGQGIGRELMRYLIGDASEHQVQMVMLEVRPSNPIALHLYNSLGFNELATRKNYYPAAKGREDGIVLVLTIVQSC